MDPMGARDVEQAVAAMTSALDPMTDRDWAVPAGELDWTCRQTAAHVAHDLFAYACQVIARPRDAYLPQDLEVRPGASPAELLRAVETSAALLGLVLDAASPDARAWHFGLTDPSGFATLAVNEVLVHTWDVCQGLGSSFEPPEELASGVLSRLWTGAPTGPVGQVLLWCTGRASLPEHDHGAEWVPWSPSSARGHDQGW